MDRQSFKDFCDQVKEYRDEHSVVLAHEAMPSVLKSKTLRWYPARGLPYAVEQGNVYTGEYTSVHNHDNLDDAMKEYYRLHL